MSADVVAALGALDVTMAVLGAAIVAGLAWGAFEVAAVLLDRPRHRLARGRARCR